MIDVRTALSRTEEVGVVLAAGCLVSDTFLMACFWLFSFLLQSGWCVGGTRNGNDYDGGMCG